MPEQSTKQSLLDAAIAVIDEKGESGVRIEDLLREVKVSAPTLYHHFGNREGLIAAAQVERFVRTLRTDLPQIVEAFRNSTTVEDLRAAVRLAISFRGDRSRVERRMQRLNALGSAYARPDLAARIVKAHEEMVAEMVAAIKPFQDKGMIRRDLDLSMVVAWYNGAVLGGLLVEIAPTSLNADEWGPIMAMAVDHLLFGD